MEKVDTAKVIKQFRNDCSLRDMTTESIRSYISELKIFGVFLQKNHVNISNIDNKILEDFLRYLREERKNSRSRIENYFSALSSFYDFLLYKGYISKNIILPFRKRYLKRYKKNESPAIRKLISIEDMAIFINSIIPIRDKAIAILLAKTGIRRGELLGIKLNEINFIERSIMLKPFHASSQHPGRSFRPYCLEFLFCLRY